jgi:hypothetical protein
MNCITRWSLLNKSSLIGLLLLLLSVSTQAGLLLPNPWGVKRDQLQAKYYFVYNQTGLESKYQFPTGVRLDFGLYDHSFLTLNYDRNISFGLQSTLIEEAEFTPMMMFGFRNVMSAPEAEIFAAKQNLGGELYVSIGKEVSDWFKFWIGYSHFPKLDEQENQTFWGLETANIFGLGFSYEAFSRFEQYHHQIAVMYSPFKSFTVEVGLLEAQEWFYQQGVLGFYQAPEEVQEDAYLSPGIYASIDFMFNLNSNAAKTSKEKIENLQREVRFIHKQNEVLKSRLDRTEKSLAHWIGPSIEINEENEVKSLNVLDKIVLAYQTNTDVADITKLQDSLIEIGAASERVLQRLVDNNVTEVIYKTTAIRIMGYSRNKIFTPSLIQALGDSRAQIRREALFALDRLNDISAIDAIKRLENDKEDMIQMIAKQLYMKYQKQFMPKEASEPKKEEIKKSEAKELVEPKEGAKEETKVPEKEIPKEQPKAQP